MTLTGSPAPGIFACDSGFLKERLGNATLSCPCCNGQLTPEKLARLLDDVQRLAQGRPNAGEGAKASGAAHYPGMIIDLRSWSSSDSSFQSRRAPHHP